MGFTSTAYASSAGNDINNYATDILESVSSLGGYLNGIQSRNSDIGQKQQIQVDQLKEIQEKEKLLLTRSRMLQISQDRNSYKTQLIYTHIASAIALSILIIIIYSFIRKRKF